MARWRQVYDDEQGKYIMVPLDDAAIKRDESLGIIVRGNFDAFRSPVDGSVIRNHRDLDNHNRRNGVVSAQEFSQEYLEAKTKERTKFYNAEYTTAEKFQRKQEINEIINTIERRRR